LRIVKPIVPGTRVPPESLTACKGEGPRSTSKPVDHCWRSSKV